jgi:hypothetical protein
MAREGPPRTFRDLRRALIDPPAPDIQRLGSERIEGGTTREMPGRLELITRDAPRFSEALERTRIRDRHPEFSDEEVEGEIAWAAQFSRTSSSRRRGWAQASSGTPELRCRRCGARPRVNRVVLSRVIKVARDQGRTEVYVSPMGKVTLDSCGSRFDP